MRCSRCKEWSGPCIDCTRARIATLEAQLDQLRAENEYLKSGWDALDESRIAFIKEAYKLLDIEDDGEYRWKWVLLGMDSLKQERDEAVGLLERWDRCSASIRHQETVCKNTEAFLARLRAASQQPKESK